MFGKLQNFCLFFNTYQISYLEDDYNCLTASSLFKFEMFENFEKIIHRGGKSLFMQIIHTLF